MVPCDVTAFMEEFVSLREGLAKVLLCAWLKEPTAVHAFARESNGLGATAGPTAVFRSLQSTIRIVAEAWPDNKAELQQISRQGVARFMGVRSACLCLEVIAPTPEDLPWRHRRGEAHVRAHKESVAHVVGTDMSSEVPRVC